MSKVELKRIELPMYARGKQGLKKPPYLPTAVVMILCGFWTFVFAFAYLMLDVYGKITPNLISWSVAVWLVGVVFMVLLRFVPGD